MDKRMSRAFVIPTWAIAQAIRRAAEKKDRKPPSAVAERVDARVKPTPAA
jgi:hypothetical protein